MFSKPKAEQHAPLVAGLSIASMTLLARYLPMSDLPMHEGVVGLLRHYGNDAYMPNGLYVLNFGHPNQLFYVLAAALAYVVSTSMAVKLVIAASQVLIFVSGARFADYLGRSRWSALLLTPLALGFTYYWGLVANLIGYAALLFTLPTFDRCAKNPSGRGVAKTCGLLLVLFFAHESMFVSAGAMIGILALHRRTVRDFALAVFPALFAASLTLLHSVWSKSLITRGQAPIPVTYLSFKQKIVSLPNVLFGTHSEIERLLLTFLVLVGAAVFAAARWKDPVEEIEPGESRARQLLFRYRFETIGLVHVAAYFFVPFTWRGVTLLHERFLGPGWALFVIVAAPKLAAPRIGKFVAAMAPVSVIAISWPQFVDASRTYSDLDSIIAHIPKGAAVTQSCIDRVFYRTRVFSVGTGPARIAAEKGGRVGLSLVFSPISPVMINPAYRWDEYNFRIAYNGSSTLRPSYDLVRWEWVVVQSRDPDLRAMIKLAMQPDADFVDAKGEWLLFRSKHPQAPLLSAEPPPPPSDRYETLGDRVASMMRRNGDESPPAGTDRQEDRGAPK
jgi:hypothetical protein